MDIPKPNYFFNDSFEFVIENHNWAAPFSNFFPGIAGRWGVPMWIYYVSRGQAICSMGIHTKDQAIMEFLSYNKALQAVGSQGFRTFMQLDGGRVFEPFKTRVDKLCPQRMYISSHELRIEETSLETGIQTSVTYFPIPNIPLPVFVRKLDVKNLTQRPLSLKLVDGAARVLPYGVTFEHTKVIPRHIEGMMGVDTIDKIPIFRLKQTPADIEQVGEIKGGYFYLSLGENMGIFYDKWIVDPFLVFHDLENYDQPWGLYMQKLSKQSLQNQVRENRTPCAMTVLDLELPADTTTTMHSLIGYIPGENEIAFLTSKLKNPEWLQTKREENRLVIQGIKRNAFTFSAQPLFDQYSQQTFLENVMRGGMPIEFRYNESRANYYIFHRQNGDLERDYHWFILEPTFFSQGNSHYRNILQNRRMDTWFFPQVLDENLVAIGSLIQLDGYNPLEVNSVRYQIKDPEALIDALAPNVPDPKNQELILVLLKNPFSIGELAQEMKKRFNLSHREIEGITAQILEYCEPLEIGGIHEGFWIDHWTYLLDMIETIRMIFPDRIREIFIENNTYTYFDNPDIVASRGQKTKSTPNGFRQYGAVIRDQEKSKMISGRNENAYKVRTLHGWGDIYTTCLLEKMLCIIANRIACLDARGYGVEMEAGKPGWLDSLNGLPGLFGSSVCESLEIIRACRLVLGCIQLANIAEEQKQLIFSELHEFINCLSQLLKKPDIHKMIFWEESHSYLEQYREQIRLGIQGKTSYLTIGEIKDFLKNCIDKLESTFQDSTQSDLYHPSGIPFTYFINEVTQCDPSARLPNKVSDHTALKPIAFAHRPMPLFLEGPVHHLRVFPEQAKEIYSAVKKSALFDLSLKMYRCSESLENERLEIGRIKAYTNGWLENGSIYTHMEYKWLLEILRAGLYEEFFEEMRSLLVPFLPPERYGRSTLENCSFIASSAFPDPNFHGRAFQPRLSGMTCEFLNIWALMTAGDTPFQVDKQGSLICKLQPVLPAWMFTAMDTEIDHPICSDQVRKILIPKDSLAFNFLGKSLVIYENPLRKSTAGPGSVSVNHYTLIPKSGGSAMQVSGPLITGQYAHHVRDGAFNTIRVRLA